MSVRNHLGRAPSRGGGGGSTYTQPGQAEIMIATVGHGEDGVGEPWSWSEAGQILVHVTYQTGDMGHQGTARLAEGVMHLELWVGAQVVVAAPGGNSANAVILSVVRDMKSQTPTTVAGVATGSTAPATRTDQSDAPAFTLIRTSSGKMLAIETTGSADVVVHAGAGVEIRAADNSAIHLDGRVHIGRGFTTAPVGAKVGPEDVTGGVTAGSAGTAHVPAPYGHATTPPYAGPADGIVRAKDAQQSNPAIDAEFWAFLYGLKVLTLAIGGAFPAIPAIVNAVTAFNLIPTPDKIVSRPVTAAQHTASDD